MDALTFCIFARYCYYDHNESTMNEHGVGSFE